MLVVFPYSHEQLVLSRLPFATMAIILLCVVFYFPVSRVKEAEDKSRDEAAERVKKLEQGNKYLKLPDEIVAKMSTDFREVYSRRQEWLDWYRQSPEEVNEFIRDWVRAAGRGPSDMSGPLEDLANDLRSMPGLHSVRASKEAAKDFKLAAVSSEAKVSFLMAARRIGKTLMDEQQAEFDSAWSDYRTKLASSRLDKFAFIPSKPSMLGVIAHQFMHPDFFHLLINMLFLWVAAVKLEDLWSRPVFIATFLFCGIAGALAHMTDDPQSSTPLMGASAAVAGLMGACLIRLSKSKIQFLYAYWFFSVSPKVGTFKAPAFVMLSIWLAAQIFSAAYFGVDATAPWSQIGGFGVGLVIAVVFKAIRFEQTVLGLEPEVHVDPRRAPLVAFQNRSRPAPRSAPRQEVRRPRPEPEPKPRPAPLSEPPAEAQPEEEVLKDSLFLPNLAEIDLPTDDAPEPKRQISGLSQLELPPIEELEQSLALPGLDPLDLPELDKPDESIGEPEQERAILSKADTSMLDDLAVEAFKADLAQIEAPVPEAQIHQGPNLASEMPLPYLPTMAVPASDQEEERHIELPAPISLGGLEGRPFSTKPIQITIREVELQKVRESGLSVTMYGSGSLMIPAEEIRHIAIGRIEKIDEGSSKKYFTSGTPPKGPALVLAAIKEKIAGKERDVILGYAIDDSKLRYEKLMRSTFATRQRNFIALTKIMLRFFKNASYMPCPGEVGENNLPIYKDADEFFGHIEEYLRQHT